ncbi:carbon-nitrogen hydrolase family protein [Clostridium beijerinckii]|uniref:carbon-nitrogen hydrolase family protein n=1 Tax=Clostridium beijerinckii TaxID=1520 RepID=UPI00098CA856|nr:carbon-nitrogen hydrolase family protein [Clostridium beijerinckii]NRT79313.1 putative amidohydrolase [Clostridium beijerinckii]OOM45856.1 (R)-stereoselective amidase [Clostridium beijerinckii]
MKIKVTCVQMEPKLSDVKYNLEKMVTFINEIMEKDSKTDLIVFPELITSGYECGNKFKDLAEVVESSNSIKVISELAKKFGTNIVYGFPEKDGALTDVLYNSSVCIDSNGRVAGVYRKVHLFDTEKRYFKAGCDFPIFNTSFGKIGVMICWDTAFPEVARTYCLKGAELLVVNTNWEKPYSDDWDLVTRARAFDNCMYLVAANRIGQDKELGFFGHSKIVDPVGRPLKELNDEIEGIISGEIDLELPRKLRSEYYTLFQDRRPELYKEIIKEY